MNKQKLLAKAISFAARLHSEQFDKAGAPYILHCFQVMVNLKSKDQELCCIAILHDTLEDCPVSIEDLYHLGMTKRVADGVQALSKIPGESYDEYKARVKANNDAVLVKMADLQHNTDIRRLKGINPKDIERTEKYFHFYLELLQIKQERDL